LKSIQLLVTNRSSFMQVSRHNTAALASVAILSALAK
jgi:hypothetical protein